MSSAFEYFNLFLNNFDSVRNEKEVKIYFSKKKYPYLKTIFSDHGVLVRLNKNTYFGLWVVNRMRKKMLLSLNDTKIYLYVRDWFVTCEDDNLIITLKRPQVITS